MVSKRREKSKTRIFYTHDNGDRPFKVIISRKKSFYI